jgi:spermidine synthase
VLTTETIATATQADGSVFVLARRGDEWLVRVDQTTLMSNRMHNSEEELATLALARVPSGTSVLIGGLGLGFTLRAALDTLPRDGKVTVLELVSELVGWNRDHLGVLNAHPLDDPRCEVIVGDVLDTIKRSANCYDAILLDVDNGPVALSSARNQRLYSERGVRACLAALRPNGVLAVWSAGPSARFERRLESLGADVESVRVLARKGARPQHVLFFAKARSR